jgi:hypothetical protein
MGYSLIGGLLSPEQVAESQTSWVLTKPPRIAYDGPVLRTQKDIRIKISVKVAMMNGP